MAVRILKMDPIDRNLPVELEVDTEDEIQYLPTFTTPGTGPFSHIGKVAWGSLCFVIGTGGNCALYKLNSKGVWIKL